MKTALAKFLEWFRFGGIAGTYFLADYYGSDPVAEFHILGLGVVMIMSGTVALEGLLLGEAASEKIGYAPNRAYQVQSALSNLATALAALLVCLLDWGLRADATIVTVMLLFFVLSAGNHTVTAIRDGNFKKTNLMRPIMTLVLLALLLPAMLKALGA